MPCAMGYIVLNPDFIGVRYTDHWPRPYLWQKTQVWLRLILGKPYLNIFGR